MYYVFIGSHSRSLVRSVHQLINSVCFLHLALCRAFCIFSRLFLLYLINLIDIPSIVSGLRAVLLDLGFYRQSSWHSLVAQPRRHAENGWSGRRTDRQRVGWKRASTSSVSLYQESGSADGRKILKKGGRERERKRYSGNPIQRPWRDWRFLVVKSECC